MSRHTVEQNVCREIVVGYDRPLRQFFGLRYGEAPNGKRRRGPLAGWPTRDGLGIAPPLNREGEARPALALLCAWMRGQGCKPADVERVRDVLMAEWRKDAA